MSETVMNKSAVPTQVGVLGGGRMGSGIAHAFLLAGAKVTVVERDKESASNALERIMKSVDASISRGFDGDATEIKTRISVKTDIASFRGHGLVVEAVPEQLELKVQALTQVVKQLSQDAVIATNTSSISISKLAENLERPERLIGLHFFNPVPASSLIEVVVGKDTSPELADLARSWVEALGKTPITVTDAPGFASSRLGVALALEAMRMVEEGVASASDIDAAMELGYRHPVGPLRTTDIVGLDVRLGIAEELERDLGPRFAPPKLLREMVAAGKLGRKSGSGFYNWTD
ncbi:MAG TPA: 3-hydroxyacyl-CoA dehydrogenase family protein [Microbacteriaceae bacterium]|nr:3-hydroxyacyl-CoA dehydrogenase family protein [Microbacteriaceae bacterium]